MRDNKQPNERTVKIELLSQWKLEAEFRNSDLTTWLNLQDQCRRKGDDNGGTLLRPKSSKGRTGNSNSALGHLFLQILQHFYNLVLKRLILSSQIWQMLQSPAVLVVMATDFCCGWGNACIISMTPTFMKVEFFFFQMWHKMHKCLFRRFSGSTQQTMV